jgi:hypothetical protein
MSIEQVAAALGRRRVANASRRVEPAAILADLSARREAVNLLRYWRRRWQTAVVDAAGGCCVCGRAAVAERRLRHRCVRRHAWRRRRRRERCRVDRCPVEQERLRRTLGHRSRLGRLALGREEMVQGRRAGRARRCGLKLLVLLNLRPRPRSRRARVWSAQSPVQDGRRSTENTAVKGRSTGPPRVAGPSPFFRRPGCWPSSRRALSHRALRVACRARKQTAR